LPRFSEAKITAGAPKLSHPIGAYSRPFTLAKLDKRTREAWLMRRVRDELTRHVGGEPSVVQRMLIERAAVLTLRLAKLDEKIVNEPGALTLHDCNFVIAWQNALTRCLVALGVEPAAAPVPTLNDILADIGAQRPDDRGDNAA
jgi:hypothetical protein